MMTTAALSAAPAPADDMPRYLTVGEFCERFKISRSFAYELINAGKVRSVRIGAARRISFKAALEFEQELSADTQ